MGLGEPPTIEPMLATGGNPPPSLAGWHAEPKLDGWRAVVTVGDSGVTARTRSGRSVDAPLLLSLADLGLGLVLDGELVANAGRATDFYAVGPTLARRRTAGLAFAAFDLLWLDGRATIRLPYLERRQLLGALDLPAPASVVPSWPGEDAGALLAACEANDVEGVVLKRDASLYGPGRRSRDWRKVKCATWRELHGGRRLPAAARPVSA